MGLKQPKRYLQPFDYHLLQLSSFENTQSTRTQNVQNEEIDFSKYKFLSLQITEEDECSRRSSPAAERLRKQVLTKEEIHSETASIVESEDVVSKIQISGTEDVFRQVIEVKDNDEESHRKISASLEPVAFDDETGRN